MGCPIRVSADWFIFANPRSLSQLVTPFIASESQGILRTPLVTFFWESLNWFNCILPYLSFVLWFDSLMIWLIIFPNMPKNFKSEASPTPPMEGNWKNNLSVDNKGVEPYLMQPTCFIFCSIIFSERFFSFYFEASFFYNKLQVAGFSLSFKP